MHETGCSGLVHWDDLEGWDGEGGGRGGSGWGTNVHPWLIHVNVWQNPPQYYKIISLQLKKKKKNHLHRNLCLGVYFLGTQPEAVGEVCEVKVYTWQRFKSLNHRVITCPNQEGVLSIKKER